MHFEKCQLYKDEEATPIMGIAAHNSRCVNCGNELANQSPNPMDYEWEQLDYCWYCGSKEGATCMGTDTVKEPGAKPFVCPVCNGRGTMPDGFYDRLASSTTDASPEMCRSCNGTGIVWR